MPLKSSWINIDRLGLKGIEPDMMAVHREPHSLDEAVNVRALGPNLANAGGYRLIPNASLPQETIPSSCACPDLHYERYSADGDIYINQAWWRTRTQWDNHDYRMDQWTLAFEINAAGNDYDQYLIMQAGECNGKRLESAQIQVLNTATARKVRVVTTDAAGAEASVLLDYDATPIFGDGQPHWVFVEKNQAVNDITFRVFVDSTQIYYDGFAFQYNTDYLTLRRANSPAGVSLPAPLWNISASLWTCLTNGSYTGLGSCQQTGPQKPIEFDPGRTNVDLDLYRGDVVVTPKSGAPVARIAHGNTRNVTGLVYFEIRRDNPSCRIDSTFYAGGVDPNVDLNEGGANPPGTVTGSFGINRTGTVWIDGTQVEVNWFLTGWSEVCFAFDPASQQIWIGGTNNTNLAGAQNWVGNRVPTVDAGYPISITNFIPAVLLENEAEAWKIVGTGSRFDPPTGYSYLEPR